MVLGNQHLDRVHAREFVRQHMPLAGGNFGGQELAGGHIDKGQPAALLTGVQRDEIVVGGVLEQFRFHDGAGRDGAHHGALDHAFGVLGVFDLVAQRDGAPGLDGPGDIAVHRAHGHARHGDARRLVRAVTGGQCEPEQFRRVDGVLEEQLEEVAHAEEQQRIRTLRLGLQVLAQHGRELLLRDVGDFRPVRHGGVL